MIPRSMSRALSATVLGLLGAVMALPTAATAAAPTRVTDRTTEVYCSATGSSGEQVRFYVGSSELSGSPASVQAATADGEFLADATSTSDWSPSTVRAAIEVRDLEDRVFGTASLSLSYRVVGTAEHFTSKFKDGNVRVVEDHTFTPVEVGDVVLTFPGVTVADVSCEGAQSSGSLFFTNPTAHVGSDSGLVVQDCVLDNAADFFLDGSGVDALSFGLSYADAPDFSAFSPELDLSGGQWSGTVNASNDDGPTPVAAQVTLARTGDTYRVGDSGRWGSQRFVITPYQLVVHVAGPIGPATVTCQLLDVGYRFRTMYR